LIPPFAKNARRMGHPIITMNTKLRKILLWVFGVWVVIMLALSPTLVQAWKQGKAFHKAFASYADALVRGDLAKAYSFCGSDFRASMTFDKFAAQQRELQSEHGSLKSIRLGATEFHGKGSPMKWTASAYVTFNYFSMSVAFVYVFHEEDGVWRVYGYKQE
jgi:hypothetical protein